MKGLTPPEPCSKAVTKEILYDTRVKHRIYSWSGKKNSESYGDTNQKVLQFLCSWFLVILVLHYLCWVLLALED